MQDRYDAIVVGAGIGGLICGSYLAKEGLRVLIVEQHWQPGGYCTSFSRGDYKFDVGVHYLGSMGHGALGEILNELNVTGNLHFVHPDPTYKIILPDSTTYIRQKQDDTLAEFLKSFPGEEKNIEQFFSFILQDDFFSIYKKTQSMTFGELLDSFFQNYKLKATINILLGNIGVSANYVMATNAIVLLRQYILDTMSYPIGGIQSFTNELVKNFKKIGGELVLSKKVVKILTKDKKVHSVVLCDGMRIKAEVVISNIDATSTFIDLIDISVAETQHVKQVALSKSVFLLYLGIKKGLTDLSNDSPCVAISSTYDLDKHFSASREDVLNGEIPLAVLSFTSHPNQKDKCSLGVFTFAPYETADFWKRERVPFSEKIIMKIEKYIGGIKNFVDIRETATPVTFEHYTFNKNGAAYGWASSIEQMKFRRKISQVSSINGLFLVGHWSSIGLLQSGIPGVAISGRKVAEIIINRFNKKWPYNIIKI